MRFVELFHFLVQEQTFLLLQWFLQQMGTWNLFWFLLLSNFSTALLFPNSTRASLFLFTAKPPRSPFSRILHCLQSWCPHDTAVIVITHFWSAFHLIPYLMVFVFLTLVRTLYFSRRILLNVICIILTGTLDFSPTFITIACDTTFKCRLHLSRNIKHTLWSWVVIYHSSNLKCIAFSRSSLCYYY